MVKENMARTRLKNMGVATAIGAMAIGFIGAWEGLRLEAYPDVIKIWTACYGETKNIKPGMKFTKAECDEMFARRLVEFEQGMRKCLTNPDRIPAKSYVAFLSLSYNIGTGAFCRSTLARKINAGDIRGACNELPKWNRAGGKVVKGLVNRRAEERKLCLQGLG